MSLNAAPLNWLPVMSTRSSLMSSVALPDVAVRFLMVAPEPRHAMPLKPEPLPEWWHSARSAFLALTC